MSDVTLDRRGALRRAQTRLKSHAELSGALTSDLEEAEVQVGELERALDASRGQTSELELELVVMQDGRALLEQRTHALEADSEKMSQDLDRARGVQRSLLPQRTDFPGVRVFCHLEAARIVGGDFYDLLLVEGEHPQLVCTVADVAGKGIAAALMMSLAIGVLREATRQSARPDDILARANQLLNENAPEQERFVTAAVATLDVRRHVLHYAGAGHEAILWLRKSGKLRTLKSTGPVLGADVDAAYTPTKVAVRSGDRLVMFTDGVTEAVQPGRRRFGARRLMRCIRKFGRASLAKLSGGLLREVHAFRKGMETNDDLTLVIVEIE